MATMEFEGQEYEVDEEGYLMDWQVWKEGMTSVMAKKDGLKLDDEHWEIINSLRKYFEKYQISPHIKVFRKDFEKKYGAEKASIKYIYGKFPRGLLQAAMYTGLPRPVGM